ncbi:MAG: GatB/YqeY domain-containing protein [Candidatus Absconditabacteria bacterium]|nr:GatB/YqeY domain-containing protein [Candidatus Absconditabacteria bacterium]MDD3868249.1 GatB/YqeY domain-containing protein [Candidatus Absconditabacteria bacterium]MDD4714623.1 GatB/YqeY domain-containing protein [Candidatus Absconditabacteria bacterium]
MSLLEQLTADYKQAMKNKEEIKKSALNYLLAQAKNKRIELQQDLTDDEIIALLKKEIKAINEAISFLEKANKSAEIAEEQEKKAVLEHYLPAMLSLEETEKLIDTLLSQLNITDLKTGRGLLMKELMANYKSELDTALVNEIINKKLAA